MRRYLINEPLKQGDAVVISGDEFHHIHVVCRQGLGDHFELINPKQDQAFFSEVVDVKKNQMTVNLLETRELPKLKRPYIHLVLNYPKPKVFDAVLEKAVELGVYSIQPVLSDYSFFKSKDKLKGKEERWQKIIKSAMQQSGRYEALELHPIKPLSQFIEDHSAPPTDKSKALFLAFYEGQAPLISQYFESHPIPEDTGDIWVFVGSEGGFSRQEVEKFQKHKIASLSLGDQVLRVETACVSIVSVLRYMSGAF